MTHKGTVTLETPHLTLRRFVAEDIEQIWQNCWSDYEVWKWTNYAPMHTMSDVMTAAHMFTPAWLGAYARPDRYSWAIVHRADAQVIGRFFGMHPDDATSQVELAYELGRAWWNQGLMTEAARAVIGFFFDEVGFARVHAYHASANPASGHVMRKCGMQYEGTLPGGCRCNGGQFDKVLYGLSAEVYRAQRAVR